MQDSQPSTGPAVSVLLGTHTGLERLHSVIYCLSRQTICDRIELIVIAPSEAHLETDMRAETGLFHGFKLVLVGPIENVDRALAHGVRAAEAPVVALLEDHAFPSDNWAECLVEDHEGPWTVVGTAVSNRNPRGTLSWANMLIAYGSWLGLKRSEEVGTFSRLNAAYKRDALLSLGSRLDDMLVRAGGLVEALQEAGHRFYVDARCSVAHVNPSRLRSTTELRFNAGRLYGASRAANGWTAWKRLLFAAIGPPLRLQKVARRAWSKRDAVPRRPTLAAAFAICLLLDGLGESVGYLGGAGLSAERLAVFETDRKAHVTAADQHVLVEPKGA